MAPSLPRLAGFNAHLGLRIVEYDEGHCVMELDIEPRHLNRGGVVHGGVLSTLVDAVCSHAGNYAPDVTQRKRSVTVALTLQFIGQAKEGRLRIVGTRVGGGRTVFFCRGEVFAPDGSLVACGDMTGRVFS